MPVRLLAVDLDGTLLTHESRAHPRSAVALRRAQRGGIAVVLASGRSRKAMMPFAKEVGIRGPMVSCNGAHLVGADGVEIDHWGLPTEVLEVIWPYALEVGAHLNVYSRDNLFWLEDTPFGAEYARRLRTVHPVVASVDELRTIEISKALLMDHDHQIAGHRAALEARIDPALGRITESEPEYLEFLGAGVSKAKALGRLCEHLGVRREETAAIGDYTNDLEMVAWAGIGGSVANGHPDVQANARFVGGTNEQGGVADFVEFLLAEG